MLFRGNLIRFCWFYFHNAQHFFENENENWYQEHSQNEGGELKIIFSFVNRKPLALEINRIIYMYIYR